jgi:hypothetical protein
MLHIFWPRFLTAIMSKPVRPEERLSESAMYSELSESGHKECWRPVVK